MISIQRTGIRMCQAEAGHIWQSIAISSAVAMILDFVRAAFSADKPGLQATSSASFRVIHTLFILWLITAVGEMMDGPLGRRLNPMWIRAAAVCASL
jgi:hypothetical protein